MSSNTVPSHAPRDDAARAALSALADGDAAAADAAFALWRDDPRARSDWHAWHIAGDVLRSEDLSTPPARDAAFLAALRTRLAAEPVLLAPAPVQQRGRAPRWLSPLAAAAGVAAVAGVLVVTRTSLPGVGGGPVVAAVAPAAGPLPAAGALRGALADDPRYLAYVKAHREGSAARLVHPPAVVPASVTSAAGR